MAWDEAWDITQRTFAYTNHTLLPEALETWRLPLFGACCRGTRNHLRDQSPLPRRGAATFPGDEARIDAHVADRRERREEGAHGASGDGRQPCRQRRCRAALEAAQETVLRDFAELWPERFNNVTNGVTPRRFVLLCNPRSRELIDEAVGEGWMTDLTRLRRLEAHADDAAFQERVAPRQASEQGACCDVSASATGIVVDPAALFDIQVKRIHEYKRQHLNVLYIITLYQRLRRDPAAGRRAAQLRLRRQGGAGLRDGQADHPPDHTAGRSRQQRSGGERRLKVVFFPDFNVKNAQPSIRPRTCPSRFRPPARRHPAPAT